MWVGSHSPAQRIQAPIPETQSNYLALLGLSVDRGHPELSAGHKPDDVGAAPELYMERRRKNKFGGPLLSAVE